MSIEKMVLEAIIGAAKDQRESSQKEEREEEKKFAEKVNRIIPDTPYWRLCFVQKKHGADELGFQGETWAMWDSDDPQGLFTRAGMHKAALNDFCKNGLYTLPDRDLGDIFDLISKSEWIFLWSKDDIEWHVSSNVTRHSKLLGALNTWAWKHIQKG